MPRLTASLFALALGMAVLALASCGEEDAQLLPGGTAREINANLDAVQRLADEGDCLGAESAAVQVSEQVEALQGVDERLKRALLEGAARLNEVIAECDEEAEAPEPVPVPSEDEEEPDEDEEKLEKEEEKLKAQEEKEREKEEEQDEESDEEDGEEEGDPSLPPQAEGEGEGLDNGNGSGPDGGGEDGGEPSGGLGPGSPAGEG
jgi:outer membrane biosynthesis protein TonB